MNDSEVGKKYIVTCDSWFFAPDGMQYRAVHGTIKGILKDSDALGISTNRHSTNWYLQIGNATIAGCQIHYAVQANNCNFGSTMQEVQHEGEFKLSKKPSSIYNADA